MYNLSSQRGFTLIELSIVLVIISLIVGGVIGGKSLIKAAEMQANLKDYSRYKTAYYTFINQYDAFPGDMPDAYDYWSGGTNAACGTDSAHYNNGCNGNGDNTIGTNDDSNLIRSERTRFWLHLQLAETIQGKVHYQHGTTLYQTPQVGVNIPAFESGDSGGGWVLITSTSNGTIYGKAGNWLFMTGMDGLDPDLPVLTPKEAKAIDKKLDDGMPTLGNVISVGANCISTGARISSFNNGTVGSANDTYTLSNPDLACGTILHMSK